MSGPKEQAKEERRRQLLDASLQVFGKKGYHQTQISDIIQKAKVARGTFYLYFNGKREIFAALMEELFARVASQVRTLPRDAVDQIPAQLLGNIERITSLLLDNPLLARLLFAEAMGLDKELDTQLRNFYSQILDYIRRGLKQGQEMDFVREGDITIMSIALLGSLKEILYQNLLGAEKINRSILMPEVYAFVLAAIKK